MKYDLAIYSIFFVLTIFFAFLINWLFLRFATNWGIHDQTIRQIRWSSERKPSIGGFSFYMLFLLSIVTAVLVSLETEMSRELIGITIASTLGFLIGLADDTFNTNPLVKFMGQLSCAFILITSGIVMPVSMNASINFIFTIFWVIGLMNSINMLDNMDGITASISVVILITCLIVQGVLVDFTGVLILLHLGVVGSILGFLYFNWHPARIYMGDTGSQFLGVYLAAVSIIHLWGFRDPVGGHFQIKQFVIPMLVFIVPLIDTTTVVVRRLLKKQSPFVGGKDHITHHLSYLGISDAWVAVILVLISATAIPIVLAVLLNWVDWSVGYTVCCLAYFFFVAIMINVLYEMGTVRRLKKIKGSK